MVSIDMNLWKQIERIVPPKWDVKQFPFKIGNIDDVAIYLVDGDLVRNDYWMDFCYGAHDLIMGLGNTEYPNVSFIPPKQIWIDGHMDANEVRLTLYHEVNERNLMKKGASYGDAHTFASEAEQELMNYLGKYDFIDIVKKKLTKLGLEIPFKIQYISKGASETLEDKGLILFNFQDTYATHLAIQGSVFLLLHELGHLFYYRSKINGTIFTKFFGSVGQDYLEISNESVSYISGYGSTHPWESFAEVFAVYCYYEGNQQDIAKFVKTHKKSKKVWLQFQYMNNLVKASKSVG